MAARSNAISELTRLWLEQRHNCAVRESLPVPVPYALSDIDLVAVRPDGGVFALPDGTTVGPRVIVETKDEHDWDATGKEFGKSLRSDLTLLKMAPFIPAGTKGVKFTMLREEHHREAALYFGSEDFDRLFVVHAIDATVLEESRERLRSQRIYWLTIRDVLTDLLAWYDAHSRRAALRQDLAADIFHLLVGFCGFRPPL